MLGQKKYKNLYRDTLVLSAMTAQHEGDNFSSSTL